MARRSRRNSAGAEHMLNVAVYVRRTRLAHLVNQKVQPTDERIGAALQFD